MSTTPAPAKHWYTRWWVWVIAAVVVIGIIGATVNALTGRTADTPAADEPTAEQADADCLTITDGVITRLQGDITTEIPDVQFLGHAAAASPDSDLTFIAVKFNDGLGEYIGVWGTMQDPTTQDDAAFVAVDEIAETSAQYLQPEEFDGKGGILPGAIAAKGCLN